MDKGWQGKVSRFGCGLRRSYTNLCPSLLPHIQTLLFLSYARARARTRTRTLPLSHTHAQVAQGMEALEALRPPLLHRDLKPSNVLIDGGGHARIADLGLAR